ncbi:unnamed protein product, partial [Mesorhabditis belari]|uniref:CX domain-containing protein n=1 Tax=Mesorhabditis belari TaxID=2138241 RepID=A0AAF3FRH9_9BILA
MSRWNILPASSLNNQQNPINNPTYFPQNSPFAQQEMAQQSSIAGAGPNEVYQHGTLGKFIRSEIEGTQSGYLKCIYQAKNTANNTVTLLCEKRENCCVHGCCPKDQYWMAGVYVLLVFVLLVFIIGTVLMILCYLRSKAKQRKAEREVYEYGGYGGSQVGAPAAYGSYIGPATNY